MTDHADPPRLRELSVLRATLRGLGAGPLHEQHLLRCWAQQRPLARRGAEPARFLPARVLAAWPDLAAPLDRLAVLRSRHPGADGSERLLVGLEDGQTVESVLLPRGGLCVSTQVGCAVGCTFCMTGKEGLLRQLGSAEIVAQFVLARRLRAVRKVVFMGMGEPAHNLDAVMEATELLGTAGGIGHKQIVVSTVGDPRVFARLPAAAVKPALALSLHTTRASLRAELLPRAPQMDPAALVGAACDYAEATGYPLQVQWTLLAGVNDGDDEVQALIALLRGRHAMLNLIPWNHVDEMPWQRPQAAQALAMSRALNGAGVLTRLRWSAGQDVEGGCGQLRARHRPAPSPPPPAAGGRPVIPLVATGPGTGDAAWH